MPLAGCGLRRFEAKMAKIDLFQTKSHMRHSLSWSSVVMWRGKRAQCHHVAMREPLLAYRVLAWDKVDAGNGALGEFGLGSLI